MIIDIAVPCASQFITVGLDRNFLVKTDLLSQMNLNLFFWPEVIPETLSLT